MEGEARRREGVRVGGTKRGKEGRREGTRAKPGNQLVIQCVYVTFYIKHHVACIAVDNNFSPDAASSEHLN